MAGNIIIQLLLCLLITPVPPIDRLQTPSNCPVKILRGMPPATNCLGLHPFLTAPVAVSLTALKYSNNQQLITPKLGKPEFSSIVSLSSPCSSTTKPSTSLSASVRQANRTQGNTLPALPRHCSITPTIAAATSPSQVPATFSKSNQNYFSSTTAPVLDIIWEEALSPSARDPIPVLNPHDLVFWSLSPVHHHKPSVG